MANKQRDLGKETRWREILKRYSISGRSVREFCQQEQVTESTFYAWRRTIQQRDSNGKAASKTPTFVPAVVTNSPSPDSSIAIELASGSVLRAMIAADLRNVQVWIATTPVDMRKSFDGLAEVVRSFLDHDPLSGSLFVFRNKGGHLIKVLWWDRDGLAIYYKRLERGEFQFPRSNKPSLEISCDQLLRLLSGMSVAQRKIA